ncbi:hypothetical protein [Frankia sp. Cppng1_Ct_nod]|uniref:hypothetical protein n=1 Tax=Frankia sp. Cppng1_Ct_nod TaxID=2897162 RepID=UPI00104108FA|nr:hypothetical protein [Frankia sp. Cppng1_Ct_nod]
MTQPDAWPYPEPYEWADEPDPVTQQAIDEAREDIAAGDFVIHDDFDSFDAFLGELEARPRAS